MFGAPDRLRGIAALSRFVYGLKLPVTSSGRFRLILSELRTPFICPRAAVVLVPFGSNPSKCESIKKDILVWMSSFMARLTDYAA